MTEDEAIAALDGGRRFYLEMPRGHRVDIVVVAGFGRRYLRTEADSRGLGPLVRLPECD